MTSVLYQKTSFEFLDDTTRPFALSEVDNERVFGSEWYCALFSRHWCQSLNT